MLKEFMNIKGVLEFPIKFGSGRASGKEYVRFMLKTQDAIFSCIAFEDVVTRHKENFLVGARLSARGHFKDKEAKISNEIIVDIVAFSEDIPIPAAVPSPHKLKEFYQKKIKDGFVLVDYVDGGKKTKRFISKDRCTQLHDGSWVERIEFLCSHFGGEAIKQEMLKENFNFFVYSKNLADRPVAELKRYKAWLDRKVQEASESDDFKF